MLVAAFRATLEDVIEADVLLHVRDIAHGETEAEAADVQNVLRQLGIDPEDRSRLIEVWNKADLLAPDERERLSAVAERGEPDERPSLVSAATGEGLDALLAGIEARIAKGRTTFRITVEPSDGGALNWLHEETEIIERAAGEGGRTDLTVRIAPEKEPRLWKRFPQAERLN
jgi:GTP-binding protein HflX